MQKKPPDDIIVESMTSNETWNFCYKCEKSWKDEKAIPGLLQRTITCNDCSEKEE